MWARFVFGTGRQEQISRRDGTIKYSGNFLGGTGRYESTVGDIVIGTGPLDPGSTPKEEFTVALRLVPSLP